MSFYTDLRDKITLPLLEKYGTYVTLRHFTEPTFNPTTGEATNSVTEHSTYAVVSTYSSTARDGTLIQDGDAKLIIAGVPEPSIGDEVLVGGATYHVVATPNAIAPAGPPDVVYYEVQIRK